MIIKRMTLCKGDIPLPSVVQEAIFDCEVNPLDTDGLLKEVLQSNKLDNIDVLVIYVTGLTVALVAVLNACRMLGIKVFLKHYNRDNNSYYTQEVL